MYLSLRKWNTAAFAAIGLIVALLVSACGGDDTTAKPAKPSAPSSGPVATSTPIPSKALWEIEWDATVEAANQEGEVTVAIFRVDDRIAIESFQSFFPKIKVNALIAGGGGRWSRRVGPEREAGIYSTDVYLTGGTSGIRIIQGGRKGSPFFADTRSILIRPDVLDENAWLGGKETQWITTDKKYLHKLIANGGDAALWVNTAKVDLETLKTAQDLAHPRFQGKVSASDPSKPGAGATFFTEVLVTNGEALTRQLLGNLKVSADGRQLATDVINGNTWISVGPAMDNFLAEGIGRHVVQHPLDLGGISPEFSDKVRITCCGENDGNVAGFYSAGIGGPALVDTAPHPNAAKVFINWLLSTEGSKAWFEANPRDCSPRHDLQDMCTGKPKLEEGKGYVTFHDEGNVKFRRAAQAVAKEVFGN